MTASTIPHPPVASREQWLVERKKLLTHEEELTKNRDRINAERRRLPMVKIDKDYVFDGPNGKRNLKALFEGPTATCRLSLHVRSELGQGLPILHEACECAWRLI